MKHSLIYPCVSSNVNVISRFQRKHTISCFGSELRGQVKSTGKVDMLGW